MDIRQNIEQNLLGDDSQLHEHMKKRKELHDKLEKDPEFKQKFIEENNKLVEKLGQTQIDNILGIESDSTADNVTAYKELYDNMSPISNEDTNSEIDKYIQDFMNDMDDMNNMNDNNIDNIDTNNNTNNMDMNNIEDFFEDTSYENIYKYDTIKNCKLVFYDYDKFRVLSQSYKLDNCKIIFK